MNRRAGVLLNGAPFASLFLILALVCLATAEPSGGLKTEIAKPLNRGLCGDGPMNLVIQVLADGRLRLNEEDIELDHLANRLNKAFLDRFDRAVYLMPEQNAAFGRVAAVIDAASVEAKHVALLSHTVARNPGNCGLNFPVAIPLRTPIPGLDSMHFWPPRM